MLEALWKEMQGCPCESAYDRDTFLLPTYVVRDVRTYTPPLIVVVIALHRELGAACVAALSGLRHAPHVLRRREGPAHLHSQGALPQRRHHLAQPSIAHLPLCHVSRFAEGDA